MIQKKVHDTFEKLVKSLEMAQEKKTVNNNSNNNRVFFFFFDKILSYEKCDISSIRRVAKDGGGRGEWGRTTPLPGLNELNLP